jgi:hypothetical protein
MEQWLDFDFDCATSYEDLSKNALWELSWMQLVLCDSIDKKRLQAVIRRQSFSARQAYTEKHGDKLNYGKDFQLRFLRKGVVGDWKNHLKPKHLVLIDKHFGEMMGRLGYEMV